MNKNLKKLFFLACMANVADCLAVDVASITTFENNATMQYQKMTTKVFGSHLFNGNFKQNTQHIYNPEYKIAIGDQIALKVWGAVEFEQMLTVDSQGNVFIPKLGSVGLLGKKNGDLVGIFKSSIGKVYRDNVFVYADMNTYQNVSVFVTGSANKPGLYQGLSSDSVIQYIDKASGINTDYGSFRNIQILRDNQIIKSIDLYDFLEKGKMELFAFRTGDVVLIGSLGAYASVSGEVQRENRFELGNSIKTLADIAKASGIKPTATNATVKSHWANNELKIASYSKNEFDTVAIKSGDEISFTPDYTAGNISINIDGEHNGLHSLVVKKGTTLADVFKLVSPNPQSNLEAIQIYRKSVAAMQKKLIEAQLKELETLALTTASVTPQEASMRASESKTILEFIERAKKVEPKGQIVIDSEQAFNQITLEDGDTLNIPTKNNIVIVQGEVALPGAFTFSDDKNIDGYIELAGDLNERANRDRILVVRANGKAERYDASWFVIGSKPEIRKGDAILVLPKAESKNLQITSVLSQILYQIAVATKVVLDI